VWVGQDEGQHCIARIYEQVMTRLINFNKFVIRWDNDPELAYSYHKSITNILEMNLALCILRVGTGMDATKIYGNY